MDGMGGCPAAGRIYARDRRLPDRSDHRPARQRNGFARIQTRAETPQQPRGMDRTGNLSRSRTTRHRHCLWRRHRDHGGRGLPPQDQGRLRPEDPRRRLYEGLGPGMVARGRCAHPQGLRDRRKPHTAKNTARTNAAFDQVARGASRSHGEPQRQERVPGRPGLD